MANVMKFYGFEFSSAASASPELSSAQNCFKMSLVVANIIFLIFGCVLCAVGAYAMDSKAGSLAGETLPQGIIAVGVFIILLSFLGCAAAFKESRLFLGVYCAFLSLFVIILMAVGIGVLAKKDSAQTYMVDGWCEAPPAVQADIQTFFMCCGLYYFNDSKGYGAGQYNSPYQFDVPPACPQRLPHHPYKEFPEEVLPCPAGLTVSNTQSCLNVLVSGFNSGYQIAGGCAIAFAVLMGLGMVVVCVLMQGIKEKKHLEEIRKLHRKLREAKEDPAAGAGGIGAALSARDAEAGYGEQVDMSSISVGGGDSYAAGELDQNVDLSTGDAPAAAAAGRAAPVDEYDEEYNDANAVAAAEEGQRHYVIGGAGAGARGAASPPRASAAASPAGGRSGKKSSSRYAQPEPDVEAGGDYGYDDAPAPAPARSARGQQRQPKAKSRQQQQQAARRSNPLDDEYDESDVGPSAGARYTQRDDEYEEE